MKVDLNENLLLAIKSNHKESIKNLIDKGAKPDGDVLCKAVSLGCRIDILELLIDSGADVNAKNHSGNTPLSVAKNNRNQQIVDFLISKGAREH